MTQPLTRRLGFVGMLEVRRGGQWRGIELSPVRRRKRRIKVEWCGRVCAEGRTMVVVPHANMLHDIDETSGDGQVWGHLTFVMACRYMPNGSVYVT